MSFTTVLISLGENVRQLLYALPLTESYASTKVDWTALLSFISRAQPLAVPWNTESGMSSLSSNSFPLRYGENSSSSASTASSRAKQAYSASISL